ncbi:MAG TPA: HEAT repeat domain-containing protein [Gemmatimonadaceae bacterium]|nr:HEAT repeat domain-containing protein [Gemmatimonadaceae bacterium]
MRRRLLAGLAALGVGLVPTARAQEGGALAPRIAAVRDGEVVFRFASRPEACGNGEATVRLGSSSWSGRFGSGFDAGTCVRGPVEVRLERRGGETARLRWAVGAVRALEGATDLGPVSTRDATRWLLHLAARAPGRVAEEAILPAVLADSATVWPMLLAIARDQATRGRPVREQATFWLGRFAHATLLGRPNDLSVEARDEREDAELKRHAVFVVSQLPPEQGVPMLLEVARDHRDPAVRGQALFWLGQSGDPRALALMEAIMEGRGARGERRGARD